MSFIISYEQRTLILIAEIIILNMIGNFITYKLAITYNLSWNQLFVVFALLNAASFYLINALTPLYILKKIVEDVSKLTVFGVSLFGISSMSVSLLILYKRFGLFWGLALGIGSGITAAFLFGVPNFFAGKIAAALGFKSQATKTEVNGVLE